MCWVSEAAGNRNYTAVRCKDTLPKIWNKNSQKRPQSPISTFTCLWAIYYIQTIGLPILPARKYVDRSWEYINSSQTHACGNWDWGRAIPFLGIHKWDFRCSSWCVPEAGRRRVNTACTWWGQHRYTCSSGRRPHLPTCSKLSFKGNVERELLFWLTLS